MVRADLIGTPLIALTIAEVARGNRPKAWRRTAADQSAAATSRA